MMPPPMAPGALFPAPPPPTALLQQARGPFPAPAYPPIFYWTYPSPPVSPTNYYNPASVPGIAPIHQPPAILGPPEPRVDALIPRPDVIDKRMLQSLHQPPCNQYVDLFIV